MRSRTTIDDDPRKLRELRREARKSATICGQCFRPLAPTDSVTMRGRTPICLLCTLTVEPIRLPGCWPFYCESETRWHRTRCLNCGRPVRIQPPFGRYWDHWRPRLNERTCCETCRRRVHNKRNAERRRVEHVPRTCANPACGKTFIPQARRRGHLQQPLSAGAAS